jgi:putative transposase
MMHDRIPRYKNHRLQHYDYSTAGFYHVEFNTKYRTHDFGEVTDRDDDKIVYSKAGQILEEEWFKTAIIRKEVRLGKFKIMPDHFHGIIQIGNPVLPEFIPPQIQYLHIPHTKGHKNKFGPQHRTLSNIVNALKGACTRRIQIFNPSFQWQVSFHDEVIRDMVQLRNTERYIEANIIEWKKNKRY